VKIARGTRCAGGGSRFTCFNPSRAGAGTAGVDPLRTFWFNPWYGW
jgi:hypothetical protein